MAEMVSPLIVSPLKGRALDIEGAVRMTAQAPGAIVLLDGVGAKALKRALGARDTGLALAPGRCAIAGGLAVLASGPQAWLLVDDHSMIEGRPSAQVWTALLSANLSLDTAVIDQTHARVPIVLEGPDAAEVLATGTPYDVHSMKPGDCTATRLSHFHVLVEHQSAERYRVFFTRSLALSAWDWLLQARAEFL